MAKSKQLSPYMEPEYVPKAAKPVAVKWASSEDVVNADDVPFEEYVQKMKVFLDKATGVPAAFGGLDSSTGMGKAVTLAGMASATMNGAYYQMYGRGLRNGPWRPYQVRIPVRPRHIHITDISWSFVEPEYETVEILVDPVNSEKHGTSAVIENVSKAHYYVDSFLQNNPDRSRTDTRGTTLSLMIGFSDQRANEIERAANQQMYHMRIEHSEEMSKLRERLLSAQLEAAKYKGVSSMPHCEGRAFRDDE